MTIKADDDNIPEEERIEFLMIEMLIGEVMEEERIPDTTNPAPGIAVGINMVDLERKPMRCR